MWLPVTDLVMFTAAEDSEIDAGQRCLEFFDGEDLKREISAMASAMPGSSMKVRVISPSRRAWAKATNGSTLCRRTST
jgi:hypothetical protein